MAVTGHILALNCGSSSVKFAIFDPGLARAFGGQVENIGAGQSPALRLEGNDRRHAPPAGENHAEIIAWLLDEVIAPQAGGLAAVGHRVVHGGSQFDRPRLVDPAVREAIAALSPLAPAHQPHNLAGIDAVSSAMPDVRQVACFDTAFHATIPAHRQMIALPKRYRDAGLRRYGFHGLSYEHALARIAEIDQPLARQRVIICHLGNGCSLAATSGGVCAHTSMGFTPLDGLMMGRRAGRLDPGAVLWLVEHHDGDVDAVRELLNQQSGLLGVSGISPDMRTLLSDQSDNARLAVDMFVDRLVAEIGAAAAAIGGIDCLAFTGGIGENAAEIRRRAAEQLAWLGLSLDEAANTGNEPVISGASSRVRALVIAADEELVIARAALAMLQEA